MATLVLSSADLPPDSYLVIRPWSRVGSPGQSFYLASGYNAYAENTVLVEFILVLQKVRVIYLRHYLGLDFVEPPLSFADFWAEKNPPDKTFIDMMFPDIQIEFIRERIESKPLHPPDSSQPRLHYTFDLGIDLSQLFQPVGGNAPSSAELCFTKLNLHFSDLEETAVRAFMSELEDEINRVWLENHHPNPDGLPAELSRWMEVEKLNAQAYDQVADIYTDSMLSHAAFQSPFRRWLRRLPPGGRVLEIGCGSGEPILRQLLAQGMDATAIELSSKMYAKASAACPSARLINGSVLDLDETEAYDAVLSINSLAYLDPVDLRFALLRIHRALKPGGLLLLHGWKPSGHIVDGGFAHVLQQKMWSWQPDAGALTTALSEYGWFEVESVRNINPNQAREWFRSVGEIARHRIKELVNSHQSAQGEIRLQPRQCNPSLRAAYLICARKR